MIDGVLYGKGFSIPLLCCVEEFQQARVMQELHEGICDSHIGGRALAFKVLRVGFYWPSLREDYLSYVRRCDSCQRHKYVTDRAIVFFSFPMAFQ